MANHCLSNSVSTMYQ